MYFVIILATCLCLWQEQGDTASLSVRVDSGSIDRYNPGDTLSIRVGTRVLLIADYDCVWEWRIDNMNSQALTTEMTGVLRLLHIVPFTREEMGVYSCDYFGISRNLTLVAAGSNLFRTYGGHSTDGVRNNSVVLASAQGEVNIQISCVQSDRLMRIGGYWQAPDGSNVNGTGNVYATENAGRGEAVLHVQSSNGSSVSEGVYICTTDDRVIYRVLLYRDVYSVVRGSGERELLAAGSDKLFVSIGEEISLVCPKDSIPDYLGANEGRIVKLIQILYIPLFTYNEAGLYHCKNDVWDMQVRLLPIDSALLYYSSQYPTLLANNSAILLTGTETSVVCAGSRSGGGNHSSWYLSGELIAGGQLVRSSPELGGLQLQLREVAARDQGLYVCVISVVSTGGEVGRNMSHSVSVYLAELQLDLLSDSGVSLNYSAVIFLRSTTIREISCVPARYYPALISANWTAASIGYKLDSTNTLRLSDLTMSGLYTCNAASAFSTGSRYLYILLDTARANLSINFNNRTREFSSSEVELVEIEVGVRNVLIDCMAFQPELTLPQGASYSGEESASYTIQLMSPRYNGVVSCSGLSHDVTRVRIRAVGAGLVREWDGGFRVLESGVSVVRDTEYFLCIGSDTDSRTEWDKSAGQEGLFARTSEYEEILRFVSGQTPEGFYTCRARNETGGLESVTQGLFSRQPYGPSVNISFNGTILLVGEYNMTSNESVLLECNSNSYPPALTIVWYRSNSSEVLSNTTRLELRLANRSLTLVCVVTTAFATGQATLTVRNPLYDTLPATANTTAGDPRSVFVLVAMSLTLLVVVVAPILVVPALYVAGKRVPAEARLHLLQWHKSHRDRAAREVTQFERYKLTLAEYKTRYRVNELESHVREVSFWESKQIRDEYRELIGAAGVKEDHYRPEHPNRTTSGVKVGEDLPQTAVKAESPVIRETVRPASAGSTEHAVAVSEQRPLIPRERIQDLREGESDKTMINVPECPDFIIVEGFYGREPSVCRKTGRKKSELNKAKKIKYLDFLFERRPDDVVFIGHCQEEGSEKFSEFVFYPHGPKDKQEKFNSAKEEEARNYQVTTVSYFSSQFYTMRQLVIREERKGTLEIRLFNFLNWPQVEVRSKTYPFIEFVKCFWYKKQAPFRQKSIVLHCDAKSRCATFISIYYLLKRVGDENDFNLFEFFVRLYQQGWSKGLKMFPTLTQYEFLHSIILDLTLGETACVSGELESRCKRLFGQHRDYNPWREDRAGRYMKELDGLVVDASKQPQEIADEKYQVIQALEERYQRQQKRKADRSEGKKGKDKKEKPDKEEESYRSDDEVEYVEDRRRFVASLTSQLLPEALYIKKDMAARRFRKEQRLRDRDLKKEKALKVDAGIDSSKEEYKQLQLFKPHLLHSFALPPSYTRYRTHKKHLEEGRAEAIREQLGKEKGDERLSGPLTNKRGLNIEEKLSQDECTRYEQFLFGTRQVQVYGPNITEENQAQGFWLHSVYGEEIISTRHPCVNDFEYANYNNPQFNLHLYKQHKVSTVIALCTFEELIAAYRAKRNLKYENSKRESKQAMSPYWLPVGQEENFGPFKVKTVASGHLDEKRVMEWFDLEYRDTKDRDTGDVDQHSIRLFLCKDWPTLMETNHTTGRHDRFVQFMKNVVAYTKSSRSEKIAIHCSDTKPYSAEFSAVFYALRQADCEGKIDMYQIAKGIQTSRRQSSGLVTEQQYFLSIALASDCLLSVAQTSEVKA